MLNNIHNLLLFSVVAWESYSQTKVNTQTRVVQQWVFHCQHVVDVVADIVTAMVTEAIVMDTVLHVLVSRIA